MRSSLSEQFKLTEKYEQQVLERSACLEHAVFEEALVGVEAERTAFEKELTRQIVDFNHKVNQQAQLLDATVKAELHALRDQIEGEREERRAQDQGLLQGTTRFLVGLH